MATVNEILKQTGLTDEQIAALDAKVLTSFGAVLTTAESQNQAASEAAKKADADRQAAIAAQNAAELAQRSNVDFYEQKIVPGLTGWEAEQKRLLSESANSKALAEFYKAQNEGARTAGFLPADAPQFAPPATPPGTFVPGSSGSPEFKPAEELRKIGMDLGQMTGTLQDIQWKHHQLFGVPLPISPTQLVQEAEAQKLSTVDYAKRRFGWDAREQQLQAESAKKHDEEIAAAAVAARTTEWEAEKKRMQEDSDKKIKELTEGRSNNPDVHAAPGSSQFAEVARAVKEGTRPDPLKMTDAQRRSATRQVIHEEISQSAVPA